MPFYKSATFTFCTQLNTKSYNEKHKCGAMFWKMNNFHWMFVVSVDSIKELYCSCK